MPAKTPTPVPANPAALLDQLIRERGRRHERVAARIVRPDQVDNAFQAACVGFLRAYDLQTAGGGYQGAFRYLVASVHNASLKPIRTEQRSCRQPPFAMSSMIPSSGPPRRREIRPSWS